MKKSVFVMFMAVGILALPAIAHAQEVNILVHKLVQKGILTQTEGQVILDQTKQEVAEGKTGLPKWVQNTKLTGSFRLRYQYDKKKSGHAQNRERIRLLLGLKSKINDHFDVGVGLTTGGGNAHSRNQTLEKTFSQKSIWLDYAYGEWTPTDWFKMIGGKFKAEGSYLWITGTHMLWDDDFSMEGQSAQLHTKLGDNAKAWWNTGLWILDQTGSGGKNPRPYVIYNQAGLKGWYDNLDATVAGTYYAFEGLKGDTLYETTGTNTLASSGGLKYNFNVWQIAGEAGISKPFGDLPLHLGDYFAVFGDYVNNTDPNKNNTAWDAGVKIGAKKVKKLGDWQLKYQYVQIAKDAFPDAFTEDDRYGGMTDVKSNELTFVFGLTKNVSFDMHYFNANRYKAAKDRQQVVQADILLKF